MFVQPFGFSNGWAELALKKPPPFVPSCLIASCEATGPPGMACSVTAVAVSVPASSVTVAVTDRSIVVAAVSPLKVLDHALSHEDDRERRAQIGSRMRSAPRTRSTQKLPRVRLPPCG